MQRIIVQMKSVDQMINLCDLKFRLKILGIHLT